MSLNRVVLTGRLVRDPELRVTQGGTSVCSVTLAVDRWKKDEGADFFELVCFGKTAEILCKYKSKGDQIGVDGRLQSRTYETKDGQRRKVVEVLVNELEFLGSKRTDD